MAKHLQQLDLFGNELPQEVYIAAPTKTRVSKKTAAVRSKQPLVLAQDPLNELREEDPLPTVSRTPMNYSATIAKQKRGRKSFASMDGDMDKLQVPSAEILAKKLYYPIGEVATWFNVNTSLIRYWEKEFKQLQPRKTRKGDRLFRSQDIAFLKQIYFLLREKKYSIDGAKTYLKNNKEKAEKDMALLNSLKNIKSFLTALKTSL
jgi:DNA-binding transcriptional MerR regulator